MQKHVFGCKGLVVAINQYYENTLYKGVLCVCVYVNLIIIQTLLDAALMTGFCTFNVPH